jgi:hypothetical protein
MYVVNNVAACFEREKTGPRNSTKWIKLVIYCKLRAGRSELCFELTRSTQFDSAFTNYARGGALALHLIFLFVVVVVGCLEHRELYGLWRGTLLYMDTYRYRHVQHINLFIVDNFQLYLGSCWLLGSYNMKTISKYCV